MSDQKHCMSCKFWMQAEGSCVCAIDQHYIYHNFTCTIDKFEERTEPTFELQMKKTAEELGWEYSHTSSGINGAGIRHYKKANETKP